LLHAQDLTAGYGGEAVISAVGLDIRAGDWLGLLGANGSGKSTLLRAVTGQIPLQSGEVAIGGIALTASPERAKAQFGYAVDAAELPHALTAAQYFAMVASIRRCAPIDWPVVDLPGQLGFAKWLHTPIAACSLGTRAKISIAAALLGTPPLVILDESLNGLDPVSSWRIKQILRSMVARGDHAVILSTHMLEAVASSCNRAILLADGRIARSWDARELEAARAAPDGFEAAVMAALLRE
jgi:ABC-2 type transport system ATP-binding protein